MRITTWNVNGVRARLTHVLDFLREHSPDVLCLQETKVDDEKFPREPLEDEGYNVETHGQKGYNGVAILARHPMEDVTRGMPDDAPDAERRVLGCIVGDTMVLNLYVPNGQSVGSGKYREKLAWLARLRKMLDDGYPEGERVAVVGDFNITFDDRDVYDPEALRETIHCSTAEREALRHVLEHGLEDSLRKHHEEAGIYTWWHYRGGAVFKDHGLRIDHILLSPPAMETCTDVIVHAGERRKKSASDHVPVTAVLRGGSSTGA